MGKWLDNSGWVAAICQSGIASPGTADSFLKATHIANTCHAHLVTAATLHLLMKKSSEDYIKETSVPMNHDMWQRTMEEQSRQFKFWLIAIQFQLTVATFIYSIHKL